MSVDSTVNESQLNAFVLDVIENKAYIDNSRLQFGSSSDAQFNWNGSYMEGPNPTSTANMWEDAPSANYADPSVVLTYFNDFFTYNAGDWTVTTTEAGAGDASETISTTAGYCENGVLKITNDAGGSDCDELQHVGEAWYLESLTAGNKLWFETKVALSDATESNTIIGLCITDTDLATNFGTTPVSDGIYFRKDDGNTQWDFVSIKNTTATANTNVATATTNFIKLGFKYDGVGTLTPYLDGVAGTAITTNIPEDEALTLTLFILNGETAAKTLYVDWVKIQQIK